MSEVTNRAIRRTQNPRGTLFQQVNKIPIYRDHRLNLRPWDRRLPPVVEQEANKRQYWELFPPSTAKIVLVLLACLFGMLLVAVLPMIVNRRRIALNWRDVRKPEIVYHNGSVLLATWVVTAVCTGLALWFVWLTEGFEKHLKVMAAFGLLIFCECIWLDVIFYTRRLDVALAIWIVCTICVILTQIFMLRDRIEIGALFLLPQLGICISIIIYVSLFMLLFGREWYIDRFTPDEEQLLTTQFTLPFLSSSVYADNANAAA